MRRLSLILLFCAASIAAFCDSPQFSGRDPGAARKDFSNVDPATGRTALDAEQLGAVATHDALTAVHGVAEVAGIEDIPNNASFTLAGLGTKPFSALTDKPTTLSGYGITDAALDASLTAHVGNVSNPHSVTYSQLSDKPTFGSMASETATDYVATSTLTAHEADTSTHGKATIAGMEDIDDLSGVTDEATARTNLGVAASSSTVLTSGANAMMGNLKLGGYWLSNDGGNEGIQVSNDGNVGIANNDPAALFCISSRFTFSSAGVFSWGSAAENGQLSWDTNNAIVKSASTSYALSFWQGGSERARIAPTTGNFIIGTTTDNGKDKLQVNGGVSATNLSSTRYMTVGQEFYPITASGGIATFTALGSVSATAVGHLYVANVSSGHNAILYITESAVTKVAGNAAITHAKGTSSSINVYVEGGCVMIQNNISLNRNVAISYSGMKN